MGNIIHKLLKSAFLHFGEMACSRAETGKIQDEWRSSFYANRF